MTDKEKKLIEQIFGENFGQTNIWSEILVQQISGVKLWSNKCME